MTRRLILAPHADDESMGCGGLLAKYPSECAVAVLTEPSTARARELRAAMQVLGVAHRILGLQDGRLAQDAQRVVTELDELLNRVHPDEVYLPYPSMHQDHMATYEAGMRASRLSMHSAHWFPPQVLVYDVQAYDVNLYATGLEWNVFEELAPHHVERKQRACECYQTETDRPYGPITSITELAAAVGRPRGLEYAERYALVRQVRR